MYRSRADACGPTILTSPFALATSAIIEITLVSPAPGGAGPTTLGFGAGAGAGLGVEVGAEAVGTGGLTLAVVLVFVFTPARVDEAGAAGFGGAVVLDGAGGLPFA